MIYFCYQGGLSSGYKNCIADKGLNDETYSSDGVALIQISGTSVHNNKAVQVDAVCTPLELLLSSYLLKSCYVGPLFSHSHSSNIICSIILQVYSCLVVRRLYIAFLT